MNSNDRVEVKQVTRASRRTDDVTWSAVSAIPAGDTGFAVTLAGDFIAFVADTAEPVATARPTFSLVGVAVEAVIATVAALAAVTQ